MLMEAGLIFIFNSADFSSPSQGQSVFKKIYSCNPSPVRSMNIFLIAFGQFLFADISNFLCLVDVPWKVNEMIINFPFKALLLHQSGNLA